MPSASWHSPASRRAARLTNPDRLHHAQPGRHATATVVKSLVVTVTGTTVTPAPAQVDLRIGEALDLTVTIDHDDELHAHGFGDIEEQLKAGVPTTVRRRVRGVRGRDP